MSLLTLLGSYANGTIIDGPEITAEFQQLINALSAAISTKNIKMKFSDGSTPTLNVDQLGAGAVCIFQVSGSDKVTITNGGTVQASAVPSVAADLTNKTYVDARKVTMVTSYHLAGALSVAANLFGQFVVPSGMTSPAIIAASFIHKTTATVGDCTILVVRRRSGADTTIGTITVPGGTAVQTAVTADFADDASTAGDIIFFNVTAIGGTPPVDVTLSIIWEQKVRA